MVEPISEVKRRISVGRCLSRYYSYSVYFLLYYSAKYEYTVRTEWYTNETSGTVL